MASIRKHGNKWEVQYRVPGYKKPFSERFDNEREAQIRKLQIELDAEKGSLIPPATYRAANPLTKTALAAKSSTITTGELLEQYIEKRGPSMEARCLDATEKRIRNHIIPVIGNIPVSELTAPLLNDFYVKLSQTEICEQKGKKPHTIGKSTIEKCRGDLRAAINWGMDEEYIPQGYNAAARSKLQWLKQEEDRGEDYISWDYPDFLRALDICSDKTLRFVILICVVCTMRIGELLALDWKHVGIKRGDNEDDHIFIEYQLQRANEAHLGRSVKTVTYFTFPKQKESAKSVLFLTDPKKGSKRYVSYGDTLAEALRDRKETQELEKRLMGKQYQDYNLVLSQPNGRPIESKTICVRLAKFCEANNLPGICTHSLRHTSVDLKLELSHGDVKAVMADGGYRTEKMVTSQYAALRERRRTRTKDGMESLMRERKMPTT